MKERVLVERAKIKSKEKKDKWALEKHVMNVHIS